MHLDGLWAFNSASMNYNSMVTFYLHWHYLDTSETKTLINRNSGSTNNKINI